MRSRIRSLIASPSFNAQVCLRLIDGEDAWKTLAFDDVSGSPKACLDGEGRNRLAGARPDRKGRVNRPALASTRNAREGRIAREERFNFSIYIFCHQSVSARGKMYRVNEKIVIVATIKTPAGVGKENV